MSSTSCVMKGSSDIPTIALGPATKELRTSGRVNFSRDGLDLSPSEYIDLLAKLCADSGIATDNYSHGGVVEQLEAAFAKALGKERAVFVPTGTLANHLALRRLTNMRGRNRVVVQAESHVFRDCGDCAQELSDLHLLPLAQGQTTFAAEEFRQQIEGTAAGPVRKRIGAVSIESAVRRLHNRRFDPEELERVVAVAREHDIALHLDGARLFIESAFSGVPVRRTAELFDTVYVSLYKAFHSGSGAILAGPSDLLEGVYHERRMFGSGMPQVWPFAAVALAFLDGTVTRLQAANKRADELFAQLAGHEGCSIERFADGTNVVLWRVGTARAERISQRARQQGLTLPKATSDGTFALKINESLNRATADQILAALTP